MQKGLELNMKDLLHYFVKKWFVLMSVALVAAIAANFYGYHKVSSSAEKDRLLLEEHAEKIGITVDELPDYYTVELAELRSALTDQEASFSEATAKLYMYQVWASDVINRELVVGSPDSEDYDIVQTLYYATEGVNAALQVMTSAQKSYYNVLVRDLSGLDLPYGPRNISSQGLLQSRWLLIGSVLGILLGVCFLTFTYMLSGKLRSAKDMEMPFGIPVLAVLKYSTEYDLHALCKGILRLLVEREVISLAISVAQTNYSEVIFETVSKELVENGIRVCKTGDGMQFVEDIAEAGTVLFVEQTGKSKYADIERHVNLCRSFNVPTVGCIVLEE